MGTAHSTGSAAPHQVSIAPPLTGGRRAYAVRRQGVERGGPGTALTCTWSEGGVPPWAGGRYRQGARCLRTPLFKRDPAPRPSCVASLCPHGKSASLHPVGAERVRRERALCLPPSAMFFQPSATDGGAIRLPLPLHPLEHQSEARVIRRQSHSGHDRYRQALDTTERTKLLCSSSSSLYRPTCTGHPSGRAPRRSSSSIRRVSSMGSSERSELRRRPPPFAQRL